MSKYWARFESREDRSILDKADSGQLNVSIGASTSAWRARNVGWNWDTWNMNRGSCWKELILCRSGTTKILMVESPRRLM